jgi:hypothetical protein
MSAGADELVAAYLRELEREAERLPWNARMELLEDVRSHIEVALAEMWPDEVAGESGDRVAEVGGDGDTVGESGEGVAEAETKSARVREILAALGEPREIVDAAVADEPGATVPPQAPPPGLPTGPMPAYAFAPTGPPYRLGTAEVFAVALLLGGFLLFGIGWIIGLILLWTSPRWTIREKLVGTFVLPGGLGLGALLIGMSTSSKACDADSSGFHHCTTSGWSLPGWASLVVLAIGVGLPIYTSVFLVRRARQRALAQSRPGRAVSGLLLGVLGAVVAIFVVGAFVSVAVGGKAGSGAVTPSHAEPSMVATYPGAPVPPSSSESESAGPASSNSTSR